MDLVDLNILYSRYQKCYSVEILMDLVDLNIKSEWQFHHEMSRDPYGSRGSK